MNLEKYKQCLDQIDLQDLTRLNDTVRAADNIIILGNGGSNAISAHIAQDYSSQLKIKTLCFADSPRLSCYANDFGWEQAYVKFIEQFANKNTLVILMSSSGESKNILNAAEYCAEHKLKIVTLSGFNADNQLKTQFESSSLHFYVNSNDYGVVECLHQLILHSIL